MSAAEAVPIPGAQPRKLKYSARAFLRMKPGSPLYYNPMITNKTRGGDTRRTAYINDGPESKEKISIRFRNCGYTPAWGADKNKNDENAYTLQIRVNDEIREVVEHIDQCGVDAAVRLNYFPADAQKRQGDALRQYIYEERMYYSIKRGAPKDKDERKRERDGEVLPENTERYSPFVKGKIYMDNKGQAKIEIKDSEGNTVHPKNLGGRKILEVWLSPKEVCHISAANKMATVYAIARLIVSGGRGTSNEPDNDWPDLSDDEDEPPAPAAAAAPAVPVVVEPPGGPVGTRTETHDDGPQRKKSKKDTKKD